jgi:hypothetical protein
MESATGDLFEMTTQPPIRTAVAVYIDAKPQERIRAVAVLSDGAQTSAPGGFDYASLPRDVATVAREAAQRITANQKRHLALVVAVGRDLLAMKEQIDHGQWLPWLQHECLLETRTAQNYMAAAERFGDKCETVSYLPLSTVYKLARPNADAVREAVSARIAGGENPSARQVERELWVAQQERKRPLKAETSAQRQSRRGREKRAERKQILEWENGDANTARRDAIAAGLADMLMSRLSAGDIERFQSQYQSSMNLERSLQEWIDPSLREGRQKLRERVAIERREKFARKWGEAV